MADEREFTTEAKEHGRWSSIVALAAAGGNVAKAMALAPAIAAALAEGSGLQRIGASIYDAKVFVFTPTRIEAEPAKPGKAASTRMLVYGVSPTSEDGEEEVMRTYRTDSARGREQEKLVRSLLGKECLVWMYIDAVGTGKNAIKVRVLEHIEPKFGGAPKPAPSQREDDGPAPERTERPKKDAKPMTAEEWQMFIAALSDSRLNKIAEWYDTKFGRSIYEPLPEHLEPGSILLGVVERAYANQHEEDRS